MRAPATRAYGRCVKVAWVTLAALVTALATGLGALPFLVFRRPTLVWLGIANAVAAGFMLSASGALLIEGGNKGLVRVLIGLVAGAATVGLAHRRSGIGRTWSSAPCAARTRARPS